MFIPKENINQDWVLGVFLIMLLVFTLVRLQEPKRLQMLMKLFVSRGSFLDYFALDSNLLSWFNILLNAIFYLTLGLLLYFVLPGLSLVSRSFDGFFGYLELIGFLVGFNLLRKLFAYFVGFVIEEYGKVKNYILFKNLYAHLIGVILLPLVLIATYGPFEQLNLSLYLLVLYGFVQLVAYLRIVYIFVFEFRIISYHLFVYLCALEILPLIVALKWLII